VSSPSADNEPVRVPSAEVTSEGLEGLNCEWCSEPAKLRIPKLKKIKGKKVGKVSTGTSILCCHQHEDIARKIALHEVENDG
jgi:hypothetical protein